MPPPSLSSLEREATNHRGRAAVAHSEILLYYVFDFLVCLQKQQLCPDGRNYYFIKVYTVNYPISLRTEEVLLVPNKRTHTP